MITVEAVTKRYGPFTAVDDVTFAAEPGRVTGFLGPNGAGKSTTLRVDADPELVGRIAHHAGIPLIELRDADGAGLEAMFLELTADTQRDSNPDHIATHHTVDPQGAVA
jgi:ABC-type sugar transport system ATPase subunit